MSAAPNAKNMLGRTAITVTGINAHAARAGVNSRDYQNLNSGMAMSNVSLGMQQAIGTYIDLTSDRMVCVSGMPSGRANVDSMFTPRGIAAAAEFLRDAGNPCIGASIYIRGSLLCGETERLEVDTTNMITAKPAVLTGFGATVRVEDMLVHSQLTFDVKALSHGS